MIKNGSEEKTEVVLMIAELRVHSLTYVLNLSVVEDRISTKKN